MRPITKSIIQFVFFFSVFLLSNRNCKEGQKWHDTIDSCWLTVSLNQSHPVDFQQKLIDLQRNYSKIWSIIFFAERNNTSVWVCACFVRTIVSYYFFFFIFFIRANCQLLLLLLLKQQRQNISIKYIIQLNGVVVCGLQTAWDVVHNRVTFIEMRKGKKKPTQTCMQRETCARTCAGTTTYPHLHFDRRPIHWFTVHSTESKTWCERNNNNRQTHKHIHSTHNTILLVIATHNWRLYIDRKMGRKKKYEWKFYIFVHLIWLNWAGIETWAVELDSSVHWSTTIRMLHTFELALEMAPHSYSTA